MPDIEVISIVIAAGAMGVSFVFIYYVYQLLKSEQAKEKPRKQILIAIYAFMLFALLMTPIAIYIEVQREDSKYQKIVEELNKIKKEKQFLIDYNGNPSAPILRINDTVYEISDSLSLDLFKEKRRSISMSKDLMKVYVQTNEGTQLGYILTEDFEDPLHAADVETESDDLLYASIPRGDLQQIVKFKPSKNTGVAIDYLLKILDQESTSKEIKRNAIKGLCQPHILRDLEYEDFDKMIRFLESGIRELPYAYWEMSQVYAARAKNSNSKNTDERRKEDLNSCKEYLNKYIENYKEDDNLYNDSINHEVEYGWYKTAMRKTS